MLKRLVPRALRDEIHDWLDRAVLARVDAIGSGLRSLTQEFAALSANVARLAYEAKTDLAVQRAEVAQRHAETLARIAELRAIVAADLDGIPRLRSQLLAARASGEYWKAFDNPEPLVSIRIATYNRSRLLLERAIPSALGQTYKNLEVVVIGDGCTDDTFERLDRLRDSRIVFANLPHQGVYSDEPKARWMVAGAPAMNEAAVRARGEWVAPLDDDDEFLPDHVEQLLETARRGSFEMAYGNLKVIPQGSGPHYELRRYPPAFGHFGFQGAIYMSALRFFDYDLKAWVLDEVADWTMCRRMLEAGVRIGWVDRPVTVLYPRGPRLETGWSNPPLEPGIEDKGES